MTHLSLADTHTPPSCGVFQNLSGDVEILDITHTHLTDGIPGTQLACNSWISVKTGWAILQYTPHIRIHIGPHSFVQVLRFSPETNDHLLLYEGQIYFQQEKDIKELRIITANGRARIKHGKALLISDISEDTTQLVALDNQASLESRFQETKPIVAHSGESTDLNFKTLRTIPSAPKAITIASLRSILAQLRLASYLEKEIITDALLRQNKQFASALSVPHSSKIERQPAGLSRSQYSGQDIQKHLMEKLTGSDTEEAKLFLNRKPAKVKHSLIEIQDLSEHHPSSDTPQEKQEKQEIIQELSKIQVE
jgi:hypothetical protein